MPEYYKNINIKGMSLKGEKIRLDETFLNIFAENNDAIIVQCDFKESNIKNSSTVMWLRQREKNVKGESSTALTEKSGYKFDIKTKGKKEATKYKKAIDLAMLAEQCNKYEDMASFLGEVIVSGKCLDNIKEAALVQVVYKNLITKY